jgi:hypothetical protein
LKVLTIIIVLRRHLMTEFWFSGKYILAEASSRSDLPKQQRYKYSRVGGLPQRA